MITGGDPGWKVCRPSFVFSMDVTPLAWFGVSVPEKQGFMRGKKYDNVGALSLEKGGEWWYNTPRNL